jgi:replicative DNA helicase
MQKDYKVKKTETQNAYFEHGKIPPQAIDLEEAVLGAMMLESDKLAEVIDFLKVECFYKESHQKIYSAICALHSKSVTVDILTVTEHLRSTGELELVGGAYYITNLTNRVSSAANIEFHAAIVKQKFIQRDLIRIGNELIKNGYEDDIDVFDQLEQAEKSVYSLAQDGTSGASEPIAGLVLNELKEIDLRTENKGKLLGTGSGFTALDRITNGWQKSDLIIIAARPGMGKTALALCAARNAAIQFGEPVALFSLEMSKGQLTQRLISSESEINLRDIRSGEIGELRKDILYQGAGKISNAALFIDDTAALSIFDLRSRARKMKRKHGIGLIIIDYLQLMHGSREKNGNREQEISSISQGLKALAKELNLPVIALSQLSRAVEGRSDKTPLLSDLRESGSIEQDADMVLFLFRPSYYYHEADEKALDVIIAKNRNGPLDTVGLMFQGNIVKVSDYINQDPF